MGLRNFWVEVEIDGRVHKLRGGPKRKDGGMTIKLHQRDRNGPREVLTVVCETLLPDEDGTIPLVTRVVTYPKGDRIAVDMYTERVK